MTMKTTGETIESAKKDVDESVWVVKSLEVSESGCSIEWSRRQN